jgi:putative membrane protein
MWGNMMGWGGYGGYGPGWGAFGLFHMLLWWVLIVLAIAVLARWAFGGRLGRRRPHHEDRALEILRERYARGEIDKTEYDARRKDLES